MTDRVGRHNGQMPETSPNEWPGGYQHPPPWSRSAARQSPPERPGLAAGLPATSTRGGTQDQSLQPSPPGAVARLAAADLPAYWRTSWPGPASSILPDRTPWGCTRAPTAGQWP